MLGTVKKVKGYRPQSKEGFQTSLLRVLNLIAGTVGTPHVIVEKLEKVFKEGLNDKEIIDNFEKTGWIVENLGLEEAKECGVFDGEQFPTTRGYWSQVNAPLKIFDRKRKISVQERLQNFLPNDIKAK